MIYAANIGTKNWATKWVAYKSYSNKDHSFLTIIGVVTHRLKKKTEQIIIYTANIGTKIQIVIETIHFGDKMINIWIETVHFGDKMIDMNRDYSFWRQNE